MTWIVLRAISVPFWYTARSVEKSANVPSGSFGALKPRFFTTNRFGVPIGWTVDVSPVAMTIGAENPKRLVTAAATRNVISPKCVSSVASLVYLCRSP